MSAAEARLQFEAMLRALACTPATDDERKERWHALGRYLASLGFSPAQLAQHLPGMAREPERPDDGSPDSFEP